jgi:hypothetical protein
MKITIEISADRIANLMCSAIESGDPVTTAAKGGWCSGIYYRTKAHEPPKGYWYVDPAFYESSQFQIEIHEVADENIFDVHAPDETNLASGALKIHTIRRKDLMKGLAAMAEKFPRQFAQILKDDTDAPCADAFLQAVVFGEEKYA